MSARRRHAKARARDWAESLPALGSSLRDAGMLGELDRRRCQLGEEIAAELANPSPPNAALRALWVKS